VHCTLCTIVLMSTSILGAPGSANSLTAISALSRATKLTDESIR